jgi:pimeloyl-ACP methyl ester carboxylesterase
MSMLIKTFSAVAAIMLATSALAQNATSADQIEHHIAKIDGTRFHYVTAGTGDPVLLIPGWPESWIAWRKVVPLLVSAGRSVVVLDPRGFGESDKPAGGYDLDTAARDLHRFLEATNLATARGVDIIAHDVGTWIAHAHAANYPADVRRLVLTESNLPGITAAPAGIPNETANLKSWQFAFNRLNDLPEILVQGHERAYLTWIFATKSTRSYAIDSTTIEEYTRQYSAPGAMRAGFAWYRANFDAEGLSQAKGARGQAIDNARFGARRIRRGGRRASRDCCYLGRPRAGRLDQRKRPKRRWLRSFSSGGMS